jgi:hypothetical protein
MRALPPQQIARVLMGTEHGLKMTTLSNRRRQLSQRRMTRRNTFDPMPSCESDGSQNMPIFVDYFSFT